MIDLITVDEAKIHQHLNLMLPADVDDDVVQKVHAASEIVMDYLKLATPPTSWQNVGTSPITYNIPFKIRAATLLVFGELWENRESAIANPLSPAVEALLHRLRDPAMA